MPRIGPWELLIILMIVLIIFGVGKLPEIGNAIGKSIRQFKKAQQEDEPTAKTSKPAEEKLDKPAKNETKS